MSWPPGTLLVCIAHSPEEYPGAPEGPCPAIGEYVVCAKDDRPRIPCVDLVEYPLPDGWGWDATCFRIAETKIREIVMLHERQPAPGARR